MEAILLEAVWLTTNIFRLILDQPLLSSGSIRIHLELLSTSRDWFTGEVVKMNEESEPTKQKEYLYEYRIIHILAVVSCMQYFIQQQFADGGSKNVKLHINPRWKNVLSNLINHHPGSMASIYRRSRPGDLFSSSHWRKTDGCRNYELSVLQWKTGNLMTPMMPGMIHLFIPILPIGFLKAMDWHFLAWLLEQV